MKKGKNLERFLGITPVSSVSNCLYFLTLPLVSVMRVIYRKIRNARYLYIKRNVEKVWGARYTLRARYLSKNTVNTTKVCLYFLPYLSGMKTTSLVLRVVLQSVPCLAVQYFSSLSRKTARFPGGDILTIKCVF